MPCRTVVLLAGRSGAGKSTFAPHLARRLAGSVLDSDDLFTAPRQAVGEATGLGLSVVSDPIWQNSVHPRLLSLLLSLAACAASPGRPVIAVSPFTGMLGAPERFAAATAGLGIHWRWVVLQAEPGICRYRISERGWEMDSVKLANWERYDQACRSLLVPFGAYVVDTSFVRSWPPVAEEVGAWVDGTSDGTPDDGHSTTHATHTFPPTDRRTSS